MNYTTFLSLSIVHASFTDHAAIPLVLRPDDLTQRWLDNRAFLLRETQNGLKILTEDSFTMENDVGIQLLFYLFPNSGIVDLCTDRKDLSNGEMYLFSNQEANLLSTTLVRSPTRMTNHRHHGYQPIGMIRLEVGPLTLENIPVHYQAPLTPLSSYWKYYFITHGEQTDLSIEDKQGEVTFTKTLLTPNTADQMGSILAKSYPESSICLFTSNQKLQASVSGRKDFNLRHNDQVVLHHLANPDLSHEGIRVMDLRGPM